MALRNKKGMFFTILTIVIVSLFILSYAFSSTFKKNDSLESRVETMGAFTNAVEKDIPRQLYVAGYRFIFVAEKNILERGTFVSNVNSSFQEAFFQGTFNGEQSSILTGATFNDMQTLLQQYAEKINAKLNLTSPIITITQNDPWNVQIKLTANVFIADDNNLVQWNKTETFTTQIPIENFDDPLYIVNTNGQIMQKMQKTSFIPFVNGNDVTNLSLHLENGRYIASSDAPSFLKRLEGNLSADANGVESLVDLSAFTEKVIPMQQKSLVDHIYFSSDNPPSCPTQPSGMPSWFRLDTPHLAVYQVSCA